MPAIDDNESTEELESKSPSAVEVEMWRLKEAPGSRGRVSFGWEVKTELVFNQAALED